ncbi:hypothetical protein JW964_28395 [candidate division KSB1 bacterium]|nr:hypothetical protein [candidate division KSB1 bacterium]
MTRILNEIFFMLQNHWFWGILILICLIWYTTITIYVAIKGGIDIRRMLKNLK